MKPEEIEQIVEAIEKADNSNIIYVSVSILVALIPVFLWVGKMVFKKTIAQVVEDSVQPQVDLVKDIVQSNRKDNDNLYRIMEMHIDELRHIKVEQEGIKQRVSRLEDERGR